MKNEAAIFADTAPILYEHGFNVVPIACGGKLPLVRWKVWQSMRQTPDEIRRLREAFRSRDIAIVLGEVSGIVDIDVDDGEVGERFLRTLGRATPQTTSFTSPGDRKKPKKPGRHLLYRHRGPLVSKDFEKGVLELRADREYTIVPPSRGRIWIRDLNHLVELPADWTTPHPSTPKTLVGPEMQLVGPSAMGPTCFKYLKDLLTEPAVLGSRDGLIGAESVPDFLPRVALLLGLSPDVGRAFHCPLPGHGRDAHPSATLWRFPDGVVKLRDWHRKNGLEFFSLAEVFAAQKSGRVRSLRGPELATWKLRLLVEAGLVDPIHIDMPPLPPEASPITHRVLAAFCHLLSCKWLYTAGDPSPFTWKFAAAWCGVPERQVGEAIRELLRLGALRRVGTWKRTTPLYLPGGVAQ